MVADSSTRGSGDQERGARWFRFRHRGNPAPDTADRDRRPV